MSVWYLPRTESILTGLVDWIPSSPGVVLRNLVYRSLFGKLGHSVHIRTGVEFVQPRYIEIGDRVFIDRNAHINSATQQRTEVGNNRIYIKDGVRIGYGVRLRCQGKNSNIYLKEEVMLEAGVDLRSLDNGLIEIGHHTYMGPYVCIAGPGPVKIGNHCLIASNSGIYGNNHCYNDPMRNISEQGTTSQGITIGDDCWLGTGVKVLDGVTIGQGCVIGAGAVVTKDVPPYSVAVGVPAKVISQRKNTDKKPTLTFVKP